MRLKMYLISIHSIHVQFFRFILTFQRDATKYLKKRTYSTYSYFCTILEYFQFVFLFSQADVMLDSKELLKESSFSVAKSKMQRCLMHLKWNN